MASSLSYVWYIVIVTQCCWLKVQIYMLGCMKWRTCLKQILYIPIQYQHVVEDIHLSSLFLVTLSKPWVIRCIWDMELNYRKITSHVIYCTRLEKENNFIIHYRNNLKSVVRGNIEPCFAAPQTSEYIVFDNDRTLTETLLQNSVDWLSALVFINTSLFCKYFSWNIFTWHPGK